MTRCLCTGLYTFYTHGEHCRSAHSYFAFAMNVESPTNLIWNHQDTWLDNCYLLELYQIEVTMC